MTPRVRALVDSGCDGTSLPKEWAARLGIDFMGECDEISGVTAAGSDTNHPPELRPRRYAPGIEVVFEGDRLRLHALFRPGLPLILLGREDFFSYFKVCFDQPQHSFSLERFAP